jgi:hypothetical protein
VEGFGTATAVIGLAIIMAATDFRMLTPGMATAVITTTLAIATSFVGE